MYEEVNKAAFEGRLEELRSLLAVCLQDGKSISSIVDADDGHRGPLHFAVLGKQDSCVLVLLEEFSASPHALDDDGWSPLHVAASVGDVRLIDLLVEEVAETDGHFDAKTLPIADSAVAVYCNQPVRVGSRNSPLHLAAAKGHEAACLRLLTYGARPDARNALGQTPLHRASAAGQVLVVTALLEQIGSSEAIASLVNLTDHTEDRQTALHLAAEDGHLNVVRLLCELGHANPSISDAQGRTALQLARTEAIHDYLVSYTETAYSISQ